jgi:hypothetical protein
MRCGLQVQLSAHIFTKQESRVYQICKLHLGMEFCHFFQTDFRHIKPQINALICLCTAVQCHKTHGYALHHILLGRLQWPRDLTRGFAAELWVPIPLEILMSVSCNCCVWRLRWSRGCVLAFSTQVRGFKPGRSRRIFQGEKILSTTFFGGEVMTSVPSRKFAACKRSLK